MSTIKLKNVYLLAKYTVGSKKEKEGPLSKYFDYLFHDNYCNEKSFEKAEQRLNKVAIDGAIENNILLKDIDVFIGSDLLNQISSSNYIMRDYDVPFIGTYSACAASGLNIILASILLDTLIFKNVLVFASSHYNTVERQYRFPIEYGVQKKKTSNYTVTGSGAVILSNKKSNIKISNVTIGKVIDYGLNNVNDFGSCMAIAAYDTFKRNLKDLNVDSSYYDLVLTGDLSSIGKEIFERLLKEDNIELKEYNDCGLLIYDVNTQNVFAGGSGAACSMVTVFSYIVELIKQKKYKRVLVIATGALLSNTIIYQKETIPSIAHAYCLEYIDE